MLDAFPTRVPDLATTVKASLRQFSSWEADNHVPRGEGLTVNISEEGQEINITTGKDDADTDMKWTFAAPLLWVNDPQFIHPSSGQRIRTLGHYSNESAILDANIIHVQKNDDVSNNLHPPPLPGSLHPRGGIYSFSTDATIIQTQNDRTLLRVEWNTGELSFFDLAWLLEQAKVQRLGQESTAFEDFEQSSRQFHEEQKTLQAIINAHLGSRALAPSPLDATRVIKDIAICSRYNDNNDEVTDKLDLGIPTWEYEQVMNSEEQLFEAMQGIFEYGAVLIRNAPVPSRKDSLEQQEAIVGNLGKQFSGGTLSHGSLYGDVFHVQSKAGAENIAYTNVGLPPHQDLTYYESKPFLQLLHCANNGNGDDNRIIGGESVLIDAMAAAEELRTLAPNIFDILCQTEATFIKERQGADMVSPKPHIVTDPALGHVVEINWSPPFEGPFQLHPRIPVESYVEAYQAMEIMLDDQRDATGIDTTKGFLEHNLKLRLKEYAREYTWEYALEPGDILVFNNQRMLHGRREFTAMGSAERHLIGCYTDAMDTISRYRQLLRERGGTNGGGYGKRNPGSGCRWI
jgi:alpha-ketoglutarate-dependent taurine dioxygenase